MSARSDAGASAAGGASSGGRGAPAPGSEAAGGAVERTASTERGLQGRPRPTPLEFSLPPLLPVDEPSAAPAAAAEDPDAGAAGDSRRGSAAEQGQPGTGSETTPAAPAPAPLPDEFRQKFVGLREVDVFFIGRCRKVSRKRKLQPRVCAVTRGCIWICTAAGLIKRCIQMHAAAELMYVGKEVALSIPADYDLWLVHTSEEAAAAYRLAVMYLFFTVTDRPLPARQLTEDGGGIGVQCLLNLKKPDGWRVHTVHVTQPEGAVSRSPRGVPGGPSGWTWSFPTASTADFEKKAEKSVSTRQVGFTATEAPRSPTASTATGGGPRAPEEPEADGEPGAARAAAGAAAAPPMPVEAQLQLVEGDTAAHGVLHLSPQQLRDGSPIRVSLRIVPARPEHEAAAEGCVAAAVCAAALAAPPAAHAAAADSDACEPDEFAEGNALRGVTGWLRPPYQSKLLPPPPAPQGLGGRVVGTANGGCAPRYIPTPSGPVPAAAPLGGSRDALLAAGGSAGALRSNNTDAAAASPPTLCGCWEAATPRRRPGAPASERAPPVPIAEPLVHSPHWTPHGGRLTSPVVPRLEHSYVLLPPAPRGHPGSPYASAAALRRAAAASPQNWDLVSQLCSELDARRRSAHPAAAWR